MTEAVARAWSRWIGGAAVGHRDIMSLRGRVSSQGLCPGGVTTTLRRTRLVSRRVTVGRKP
jgi:hypothetical protein